MPTLENAKHEVFAQKVAGGSSDTAAYKLAYDCKQDTAESNASRLRENAGVVARVTELQERAASKLVMSIQQKREFLKRVVDTPIGEIDETSELCQAVKRTDGENSSSVEYKMPCKLTAIKIDNELSGHVKIAEKGAVNVNIGVVFTEEKRSQIVEKKRAAIRRRLGLSLTSDRSEGA